MRVVVTVAVLVLINIHLINIKDTAMGILFYDPNAHLKSGSLRILGSGNDLCEILVAVIDINTTIDSRRRLIRPMALRCDGIQGEAGRQVDTDRDNSLIKVQGIGLELVVNTDTEFDRRCSRVGLVVEDRLCNCLLDNINGDRERPWCTIVCSKTKC
jgi:hypothetical protein